MIDILGNFKPLKYFNYKLLRKSFMKFILDLLHHDIGAAFYQEKTDLYNQNDEGFYVHAPDTSNDFSNQNDLIKYILRYTGRPAMAESRILEVKDDFVTYFYEPHEDDHLPDHLRIGKVQVQEHVYEFIKKLIMHIHDKQFKMIRYYGLYTSVGRKRLPNYKKKVSFARFLVTYKWRSFLKLTFNYDILLCRCGFAMKLVLFMHGFP